MGFRWKNQHFTHGLLDTAGLGRSQNYAKPMVKRCCQTQSSGLDYLPYFGSDPSCFYPSCQGMKPPNQTKKLAMYFTFQIPKHPTNLAACLACVRRLRRRAAAAPSAGRAPRVEIVGSPWRATEGCPALCIARRGHRSGWVSVGVGCVG